MKIKKIINESEYVASGQIGKSFRKTIDMVLEKHNTDVNPVVIYDIVDELFKKFKISPRFNK